MRTLKRGGGILNRIKGFFTRKKKAVAPIPTVQTTNIKNMKIPGLVAMRENYRMPLSLKNSGVRDANLPEPEDLWEKEEAIINGVPTMLKREPLISTYNRLFSYFYRKAFKKQTMQPNKISEKEFNELSKYVRQVSGWEDLPDDEDEVEAKRKKVALEVFGEDNESEFDNKILEEEIGVNYQTQGNKVVTFDGISYITDQYGRYFARYYPYFFTNYKKLLYLMEYDLYQCSGRNPEDSLLNRGPDGHRHQKPLVTLKSNLCISLFRSIHTVREELTDTDELRSNWLILDPDYFPAVHSNPFSKKDMFAKYFTKATFIQDALDNWGIHGIDPLLFELFQKRYPEIAIKMSTYIVNTADFVYQAKKLKAYENMMIIDKSLFPDEIALTIVYPFEDIEENSYKSILEQAITQKKIYSMTPYMAYIMKRKSMSLWKKGFEPQNGLNAKIYENLNAHQKITVDFLQYLRFIDVLQDSGYNFIQARKTYEDFLGGEIMKEILALYKENIVENKKQLLFLQSLVSRQTQNKKILQTPQDIQDLLLIFYRNKPINFKPVPRTATKTVFAPMKTENLTRKTLVERHATLLHSPNLINSEGRFMTRKQALNYLTQQSLKETDPLEKLKKLKRREEIKKIYNEIENTGAMLEGKLPPNKIRKEYEALKKNSNLFNAKGTRKNRNVVKRSYNNRVALARNYRKKLNILKEREAHMKKFQMLELVEQKLKATA